MSPHPLRTTVATSTVGHQFRRGAVPRSFVLLASLLMPSIAETPLLAQEGESPISVIFGAGIGFALDPEDIEKFKIVGREDTRFIVRESDSHSIPQVLTGLKIKFRDPSGANRWLPSSTFISADLAASDVGPVRGVSIGLGWEIVPEAHLLLGFSSFRSKSLREDLRTEWLAAPDGRLEVTPGETEESILGTEGANMIFVALAVPISFSSTFGGDN